MTNRKPDDDDEGGVFSAAALAAWLAAQVPDHEGREANAGVRMASVQLFEMFTALQQAGFTEDQAMQLTVAIISRHG